jgi:DNA-binding CsgD family transcriptional regulator/tetratricopeptide (TPR) repeat protein
MSRSTIDAMLYGRDAERSRIQAMLERGRESQSAVLVIRGEAGVGKSALLDDAREEAAEMTVLSCHGVETEARLPYAALHQLVRPVLEHIDALPERQAESLRGALGLAAGHARNRFLVSLASLCLLAEAAERRPLLCLVDDAHHLDEASADALVFIARRLEAEAIVILFAARDGEARRFEAPGLPELQLTGLDPAAAGALLDGNSAAPLSLEARRRLIEGTRGNPLALIELPRILSESQLAGREPLLDPLPVSERVQQAFLDRVRALPEPTQTLLLVAAADEGGEPAAIVRAAKLLGAAPDALDAAEVARLVSVTPDRLDFRHPLVRSAIYQSAPLSQRQAAHRALAEVLDREEDADRRAWHRAAASLDPDPEIVDELERAGERARMRSCYSAASLAFERAATLAADDPDQARLLSAAAENAWLSGRLERALVLYERARPLASGSETRIDIDRGRGLIELNLGRPADAYEILMRAASEAGAVDAERALYALGIATLAAAYAGDGAGTNSAAELALSIAADGDETTVSRFLAAFIGGVGAYFAEDFTRSAQLLQASMDVAHEAEADGAERFAELGILASTASFFRGDDRTARRFSRRAVARARDEGAVTLLTHARARLAISEIWEGEWASAAAALAESVELARGIGQHQVVAHLLADLAMIAGHQGDEERCRTLIAESRELASERGLGHVMNMASCAILALELGRGDAETALASAREMTFAPITLWFGLDRIEAAVRAGDTEIAREWLGVFERWTEQIDAPWARASIEHCRALLAADGEVAARHYLAALRADPAAPEFCRARTELAYGEFLRRARRRVDARGHLQAAFERFDRLGAEGWAERARLELRASGQSARRRDPTTRDELTARELQVAQFVARGLTNSEVAAQLFLSPRTIDFHLRNVFRKLDITSRTQLAHIDLGSAGPIDTESGETGDFTGATSLAAP